MYIILEQSPSIALSNEISRPGKHGHAKCRITANGLIDNKKRVLIAPGELKIQLISVDKRQGQIVSVSQDIVQLMDVENYEMRDAIIANEFTEKLNDGDNVEYWVIENKNVIKAKSK